MPCVSTPADIFLVFRTLLNCLKCIIYEDYYNYYTDFFELGQQKINFSFYELSLPDDDPFSTLKKVMEDLDFSDLLDSIELTFTRYNTFLQENGYGLKYDIGNAQMFVIEGMDKVRSVIEKNRKRKLSKHKKLANNTVIEIDNCSPLEILKLQTRSIQTEGHFGDIKENENFRRFNYRSADKVYKEFMLYAIGRNINKYCRFLNEKLKKFEGKTV